VLTVKGQVMTVSDQVEMPLLRTRVVEGIAKRGKTKKKQSCATWTRVYRLFLYFSTKSAYARDCESDSRVKGQQDIAKSLATRKCSRADSPRLQSERLLLQRPSIQQAEVLLESYAVTSDGDKLRLRTGDSSERKVKVDNGKKHVMILV